MQSNPRAKLADSGIELPAPLLPAALQLGSMLAISGQLPMINGRVAFTRRLGNDVDIEAARQAAARCALNILAIVDSWCAGGWGKVVRCARRGGFFQVSGDFFDLPKAMNGASDLLVTAMEDMGRHVRTTVGVATLPMNAAR